MEEKISAPNVALETAKKEIEEILKKYNVVLLPIVIHQGDKTFSRIDIAPLQDIGENVPV